MAPFLDALDELESYCLTAHALLAMCLPPCVLAEAAGNGRGPLLARHIRTAALRQFELDVEYPAFSLRGVKMGFAHAAGLEMMAEQVDRHIAHTSMRQTVIDTLEAIMASVRQIRAVFVLPVSPALACRSVAEGSACWVDY